MSIKNGERGNGSAEIASSRLMACCASSPSICQFGEATLLRNREFISWIRRADHLILEMPESRPSDDTVVIKLA